MESNFKNLIIPFVIILIVVGFSNKNKNNVTEGFTMSDCPNCGKRNKMDCFQCSECVWCITPGGYGECVPGNSNGPYFRKDCVKWYSQPDPVEDYQYYLPGWRQWWWWTAPQRTRDRLQARYMFKQPFYP